jgi:hypothetical protein
MNYLKGYSKNRLKGISFAAYITQCDTLGTPFVDSNTTKYLLPLLEHPTLGTFALEVSADNQQYIDADYIEELENEAEMTAAGWFAEEE